MKTSITKVSAREIIDSRGNPTVEATVVLSDGSVGIGTVPSGASTGIFEAHELRDNDSARFGGKGVLKAVKNVNEIIAPRLLKLNCIHQSCIDNAMIELDGTTNKSKLGANAILAVSLAAANAAAKCYKIPLYRYLGGISAVRMPVPMMNIMNGGAHASNNVDIQEFMIVPLGFESFSEGLRAGCEIYHSLGQILRADNLSTAVGDEGGYAPMLASDENAIEYIIKAIETSGYDTERVKIALDAASSEWNVGVGSYKLPKRGAAYNSERLADYWEEMCRKYPIISIEDGMSEEDYDGWKLLTERLGNKIKLVGDDLFVTNPKRFSDGISIGYANSILIKPNQIGTLSETLNVITMAAENGYSTIISHRSGETADTAIADIAVALNAGYIKTGAPCRSERVSKYNRLLKIESEIPHSLYN